MNSWLLGFFRVAECSVKDELIRIGLQEFLQPLDRENEWMKTLEDFKRLPGPRFPDGSINWQCPCMAGGSLVAHRCGHFFRELYVCMSADEDVDATIRCPKQFVNWAACMQNMTEERRKQMESHLIEDGEQQIPRQVK